MTFTLRPSTSDDLEMVEALLARAYPVLLAPDYSAEELARTLPVISRAQPALLSSGTYFLAVEADGSLLGAGGWTPDASRPGVGHVRHVVTDDRAVRRGVGRTILSHALDTARAAGISRMACTATRTAVPFYAALGFEETGPVDLELVPGVHFPAVEMTRAL